MSRIGAATIGVGCALVGFLVGLFLGGHLLVPTALQPFFAGTDRALREQVIEEIQHNFYRPVDRKTLDDLSVQAMVQNGLHDPFSHYFSPAEMARFQQSVSGQFDGVGMTVQQHPQGLLVLNVFAGSPAEHAGIRKDDVISNVDGQPIAGQASQAATAKVQGPAGTAVTLGIVQGGGPVKSVTLRRQHIEVPVAESSLATSDGKKVGVVKLLTFSSQAHTAVRQKIDDLQRQGAQAIVLDLRGNGGGLLQEAVGVGSNFIDRGPIVSTQGRAKPRNTYQASGGAISQNIPMAVLVDHGTASASEIVTGALHDYHRATIVGEKTFGKGVFEEVEPLSNGGALDLTVGRYFLPGGEPLPEFGIQPDVVANQDPQNQTDTQLPVALKVVADQVR
jgi:carboxyl-terminal processing protease